MDISRRSVALLGASGLSLLALTSEGGANASEADAFSVRRVADNSGLPGIGGAKIHSICLDPGSSLPSSQDQLPAIYHLTDGTVRVVQEGKEFRAEKDDIWIANAGVIQTIRNSTNNAATIHVTVVTILPD